jgi:hypothetical protein
VVCTVVSACAFHLCDPGSIHDATYNFHIIFPQSHIRVFFIIINDDDFITAFPPKVALHPNHIENYLQASNRI